MPQHSERPTRAQIIKHLHEVEQAALALTGIVEYGLTTDDWETRVREKAKALRVLVMDRPPIVS
jgi:carbon monoxide dehydrogenase subunit G